MHGFHNGIYVGAGMVVHYDGDTAENCEIVCSTIKDFSKSNYKW